MSYDLIIIGAGHNGLTAAAAQAARSRKVLVLEARPEPGGLAAGLEFHPGFRTSGILHDSSALRGSVISSLGLEKHGLRRRPISTSVFAPQAEGPGLLLHGEPARAAEEIAVHSTADAERYAAFCEFQKKIGPYLRNLLNTAAPDISPSGIGQFWDLFRRGLGLRRLGREDMFECLRIGPLSVSDWLGEWFENDLLKANLAAPALLGTWTGPRSAGTAALLLMQQAVAENEIIGGPAALVRALVAACQERGVEIRCESRVGRILVADGRVKGVELADGQVIESSRVASAVDPRQTFLDLIDPRELPVGLAEPISHWRCRGTTAKIHLALDGSLEFSSRPGQSFDAVRIAEGLVGIERAFDAVKYRRLPEAPHLDIRVPSLLDAGLAPDGKHVVSIQVHFVPRDLDGGWTEEKREELMAASLAQLSMVAPSCRDRILGHQLLTPEDLEREFGVSGGHVHHGEHGLDQLLSLRPHARCARYTTPVAGLYLCGSGSHPGGGISAAPGMLAAQAIR
ncbi:MAG: phytoene desaturase family protein [Planctomycetota bacterium]|jgi:phytoene dehydrogenase-like protein